MHIAIKRLIYIFNGFHVYVYTIPMDHGINLEIHLFVGFFSGGVVKGRGCSWGTLGIPAGKIGEP